jgi:Kef-type K+ transport system membrane component KefB
MGSILSSHTPIGYPIIQRLGLVEAEAVVVTIGATVFTDISALFVLAICVSINAGEFTFQGLIWQFSLLGIYSAIVLLGFSRLGKIYFQRTGDDESNQFLFVLMVLFVASVGAQIIKVDMIVGAFLAGLAINEVVGNSPVKEKVEFLGSVLFIPFFFHILIYFIKVSSNLMGKDYFNSLEMRKKLAQDSLSDHIVLFKIYQVT